MDSDEGELIYYVSKKPDVIDQYNLSLTLI